MYKTVQKIDYPSASEAGRRIVYFLGRIDIFLEVQNEKYGQILYLIDNIAYGPQFPHKFRNSPKSAKTSKCFIVTPATRAQSGTTKGMTHLVFQVDLGKQPDSGRSADKFSLCLLAVT